MRIFKRMILFIIIWFFTWLIASRLTLSYAPDTFVFINERGMIDITEEGITFNIIRIAVFLSLGLISYFVASYFTKSKIEIEKKKHSDEIYKKFREYEKSIKE